MAGYLHYICLHEKINTSCLFVKTRWLKFNEASSFYSPVSCGELKRNIYISFSK